MNEYVYLYYTRVCEGVRHIFYLRDNIACSQAYCRPRVP